MTQESQPQRVQRSYARFAGAMYLVVMAVFIFGEAVIAGVSGSGEFAETAARVAASASLYRFALASIAIGALGVVVLSYALYVTLEPVNRRVAQLALASRLGEAIIIGSVIGWRFVAVRLFGTAHGAGPFEADQLQLLVVLTDLAYASGVHVWLMFAGFGSLLFFHLFYVSRYLPRALAALGVAASAIMIVTSVGSLVFPAYMITLRLGWGPIFVAEIATGIWLLVKGINVRAAQPSSALSP